MDYFPWGSPSETCWPAVAQQHSFGFPGSWRCPCWGFSGVLFPLSPIPSLWWSSTIIYSYVFCPTAVPGPFLGLCHLSQLPKQCWLWTALQYRNSMLLSCRALKFMACSPSASCTFWTGLLTFERFAVQILLYNNKNREVRRSPAERKFMCWDDEPIKLCDCSRPCSQHVFPHLLPFNLGTTWVI